MRRGGGLMEAANLGTTWLPAWPEWDPPQTVGILAGTSIDVGTMSALDIEWRVDAVLTGTVLVGSPAFVCLPGLVVRPCRLRPLDRQLIERAFSGWIDKVFSSSHGDIAARARRQPLPSAASLARGALHRRVPAELRFESAHYWANRALCNDNYPCRFRDNYSCRSGPG